MSDRDETASPRLARLEADLVAGHSDALPAFWTEIERAGAPLIEPIAGDTSSHVTFLWRGDDSTENVAVIGDIGFPAREDGAMRRLLDSDVWYRTVRLRNDFRLSYSLSPNDPLTPWTEVEDWAAEVRRWIPDPLNPRVWIIPAYPEIPTIKEDRVSVLELPDAPPQQWSDTREETPAGRVEHHRLWSAILDDERSVFVYTPPGYDPSHEGYPLLIAFDGLAYVLRVPTPTILDNLAADELISPTVAVMVQSGEHRARYLCCYPPFAEYLATELMPWIRAHYRVTDDPSRTVVAGSSFGGLAAMFAALQHPEIFGNVLSQSGSYWWAPDDDSEPEWLARQVATRPRLPLRFYLDVGLLETSPIDGRGPTQLMANRHMRDVLHARRYPLTYSEYMGGHDYLWWRGTLADGLLALGRDAMRRQSKRTTSARQGARSRLQRR